MDTIFVPYQPILFAGLQDIPQSLRKGNSARSGTFVDNMKLPVHQWFRYSAGFSADWVRSIVREKNVSKKDPIVLDPFAGVGTTLLACDAENVRSIGFETHPFVYRIAKTKLDALSIDLDSMRHQFDKYFAAVLEHEQHPLQIYPDLIHKCYGDESLSKLDILKATYLSKFSDGTIESRMIWLAITAILRSTSSAGTAQWQYVLPKNTKSKVLDPYEAFRSVAQQMYEDIAFAQRHNWLSRSHILETDSRNPEIDLDDAVDLVITSPPYPNNYDYADATRLEMTFWGEVEGWKDLQGSVRKYLIRSCSQHASAERLELETLLDNELLSPIHDDLAQATQKLAEIRLTKGGRKTYHTMAAAYFLDMAEVFESLRRLCRQGSELCIVIGDSAPYGVYLHVDEWLGKLALSAGFSSYRFEKIRDRNIKWKNRKHRVPLKEGRLWIRG